MARIPPKRVASDDRDRLHRLEADLKTKIFGQDGAVERVAQRRAPRLRPLRVRSRLATAVASPSLYAVGAAPRRVLGDLGFVRRRMLREELGVVPGISIARFVSETFALRSTYDNRVRLAKARRLLDQCVQHRL